MGEVEHQGLDVLLAQLEGPVHQIVGGTGVRGWEFRRVTFSVDAACPPANCFAMGEGRSLRCFKLVTFFPGDKLQSGGVVVTKRKWGIQLMTVVADPAGPQRHCL